MSSARQQIEARIAEIEQQSRNVNRNEIAYLVLQGQLNGLYFSRECLPPDAPELGTTWRENATDRIYKVRSVGRREPTVGYGTLSATPLSDFLQRFTPSSEMTP